MRARAQQVPPLCVWSHPPRGSGISTMAASRWGAPECRHASAGGPALWRAAARGATRGRRSGLSDDRAPAAGRQPRGPARALRPVAGRGGAPLRAAACGQPRLSVQTAARRSAPPGRRAAAGPRARPVPLCPCPVDACCGSGRRRESRGRRHAVDDRLPPHTLRPVVWDRRRPAFWAGNTNSRPMCRPTSAGWANAMPMLWGEHWAGQIESSRWPPAAGLGFCRPAVRGAPFIGRWTTHCTRCISF